MNSTNPLHLEAFEDRIVPAVNVTFDPIDDVLSIVGSNASEHIHVKISPISVEITGSDGTVVDIGPSAQGVGDPQNFFLGEVEINMKGGNDTVTMTNSAMFNGLTLNMGAGDDHLSIDQNSGVVGPTKIRLGRGHDQATVYGQYFGTFKIYGGRGHDNILIGSGVQTELYVYGGGGHDQVTVQSLYIPNGLHVNLGRGDDKLELTGVVTGEGSTSQLNGGRGTNTFEFNGGYLPNTTVTNFVA